METIAFFDAKPYDRAWFDRLNPGYEIRYFECRLTKETAVLARGCAAVCAFVNDRVDADVISALCAEGCRIVAMRCAGVNNVDAQAAQGRLALAHVPGYSPHAVAEHTMALLLTLNRKLHRAWARTRDFNFSLSGLEGVDLFGKTAGVVGTGRIGRAFAEICITRQIITAIKTATRQKHVPLNSYVSLSRPVFDENSDKTLIDLIAENKCIDPEELFINKENYRSMGVRITEILSEMELRILSLYLEGKSYQEMSQELGKQVKSIDNALQRVKRKLEKQIMKASK